MYALHSSLSETKYCCVSIERKRHTPGVVTAQYRARCSTCMLNKDYCSTFLLQNFTFNSVLLLCNVLWDFYQFLHPFYSIYIYIYIYKLRKIAYEPKLTLINLFVLLIHFDTFLLIFTFLQIIFASSNAHIKLSLKIIIILVTPLNDRIVIAKWLNIM